MQDTTAVCWMPMHLHHRKMSNFLPETYVIFITEHDVIGKGEPIYRVERKILETDEIF